MYSLALSKNKSCGWAQGWVGVGGTLNELPGVGASSE